MACRPCPDPTAHHALPAQDRSRHSAAPRASGGAATRRTPGPGADPGRADQCPHASGPDGHRPHRHLPGGADGMAQPAPLRAALPASDVLSRPRRGGGERGCWRARWIPSPWPDRLVWRRRDLVRRPRARMPGGLPCAAGHDGAADHRGPFVADAAAVHAGHGARCGAGLLLVRRGGRGDGTPGILGRRCGCARGNARRHGESRAVRCHLSEVGAAGRRPASTLADATDRGGRRTGDRIGRPAHPGRHPGRVRADAAAPTHESATGAGPGGLLHRIRGRADLARRRPGHPARRRRLRADGRRERRVLRGERDVRGRPARTRRAAARGSRTWSPGSPPCGSSTA